MKLQIENTRKHQTSCINPNQPITVKRKEQAIVKKTL